MESLNSSLKLLLRMTVAMVAITFIVLSYYLYKGGNTILSISTGIIAFAIIAIGSFLIYRMTSQMSKGEVIQDEMSISRLYKSSYITFNISILLWLGIASFVDSFSEIRYAFYTGIFSMFAILGLTNLYLKFTEFR